MTPVSEGELLFTEEEWNAAMPEVVRCMTEYLKRYRAGVFKDFGDHGTGHGTGSFLSLGGEQFILTAAHVAETKERLAYSLSGTDELPIVHGNRAGLGWPYDLALLPVARDSWASAHGSEAIALDQIAFAHQPVEGEIFTLAGYSGAGVKFFFETLNATATCYTSREVELPSDVRFNSRYHLGLAYPPDLAIDVIGREGLPPPPGLSGSTLWNTRFVECRALGLPWSPSEARVTGVIWGWPSSVGCLIATRAEYLRSFLLGALEHIIETPDGDHVFAPSE